MLSPNDRTLLVDLLAPPEAGYRLEHAVGTTFTLHLTALLPIPLGLAGADLSSSTDKLSLLHAIRNYQSRIDIFCQAGHMAVPSKRNDLFELLGTMVHQVRAPGPGHLFHPKLWVLRFINDDGEERYRLVCGSRNLTHDRAWDVVITLDGYRVTTRRAVNRPIAEFLRSLPGRVPAGIPAERAAAIADLADGLDYVEWEHPDDAFRDKDWLTFHVLGSGHRATPNLRGRSRLIVSPFVNDDGLETVWPEGKGRCVIVSRAEELDGLGEDWREWFSEYADKSALWVLDDGAALPEPEDEETEMRWSLTGLHAKLYVVEREQRAHVFIGSANATDAAWSGNDEILVEMVGRTKRYGIEATVGPMDGSKGKDGFGQILLPYLLGEQRSETDEEKLRRKLENALRQLAALTYTATVEGEHEQPLLWLRSDQTITRPPALPDATLTVGLLTMPAQPHPVHFGARLDHRWQLSEVEDITPFLVLRLAAGKGASRIEVSSIVLARLIGDPEDRLDRLLARRIGSPSEFLRFVLLLLQLAGRESWFEEGAGSGVFGAFTNGDGAGLLEAVLTALASTPGAIDDIDRLVKRLIATEQGRKVLPDDWTTFWPAVVEARSRVGVRT